MAGETTVETKLEKLAGDAIDRLQEFLKKREPTSLDVSVARVASSALASYSKVKQTEGAREATVILMARELAEDKGQMRTYLKAALPSTSGARRMLEPKALS